MAYRIEYECDQTFVDPTTGEIGIRAGERRLEGHKDIGVTWKPVIVEVEDEKAASEKSAVAQSQRQVAPDQPHAASSQQQPASSVQQQPAKTAK